MKDTHGDLQTRRIFCAHAAAFAVFGGALSAILPACSSPTAPSQAASLPFLSGASVTGGVAITIDAGSPLAAVGAAALVRAPAGDLLVARTAQDTFVALGAICTHQNCTITGFDSQHYVCPCHGSTFDLNGHVLGGPAPASLRQYSAQFTGGVLTIAV